MEQWEIDNNRVTANEMQAKFGYAPSPACSSCSGSGRIHPLHGDGRVNYGELIRCEAPGCLDVSYLARSF